MSKPLISGFTFIKHGLQLGYPIRESIESIEPLCDEIIVNVGFDDPELKTDDGTWEYLNDHFTHDKIKFVKSWWDPTLRKDGLILSQQTNIALQKCSGKYCQYIQGDEALHEDDLSLIQDNVLEMERDKAIDGLVFDYIHFYGNVDVQLYTRRIYRQEMRLIRNGKNIISWKDAQGFRYTNESKIPCKKIPARVFHYGWARKEQIMATKVKAMDKLYHEDPSQADFSYKRMWGLRRFEQTHPSVMTDWTTQHKNDLDVMALPLEFKMKDLNLMLSDAWENLTGHRIGEYKNFKLLR
tara:strand:+ start:4435 stop:5322 length:888 start_codon:yes stop_codon:yes gene_type:complete